MSKAYKSEERYMEVHMFDLNRIGWTVSIKPNYQLEENAGKGWRREYFSTWVEEGMEKGCIDDEGGSTFMCLETAIEITAKEAGICDRIDFEGGDESLLRQVTPNIDVIFKKGVN